MRTRYLVMVSLAACGGASKPGGVGNVPGAGAPAGPPPTVAWTGDPATERGTFAVEGLPAVSDDGSRALIAWTQGDGGRGYPNLRLLTVDRADLVLDTRVVLDQDSIGDDWTGPVDVTGHNAFLAESNQRHRWRLLASAPVERTAAPDDTDHDDDPFPKDQTATLGDVAVRFDDRAHLVIEQGGKVVVDAVKPDWLVKPYPMYEGAGEDEMCSNPIYLGSVHVDGARRLAVIGVEYFGTDTCWEPTGAFHVVTW